MNEPAGRAVFRPVGWRRVTPRIITREPRQPVQFIIRVFEADGHYQSTRPRVLRVGDCMLMISDAPLRELPRICPTVIAADRAET